MKKQSPTFWAILVISLVVGLSLVIGLTIFLVKRHQTNNPPSPNPSPPNPPPSSLPTLQNFISNLGSGQTSNIILLSFDRQNTFWIDYDPNDPNNTDLNFEVSSSTPNPSDPNQQFYITTDPNTGQGSLNWVPGSLTSGTIGTFTSVYGLFSGVAGTTAPLLLSPQQNCPGMWIPNDFNQIVQATNAYLSSGELIGDSSLGQNYLYWVAMPDSSSCSDFTIPEIYVLDTGVPVS